MYVPRVFYTETVFKSRERVENIGLESYLELKNEAATIEYFEEYALIFHGIIVQNIEENELSLIALNDYIVLSPGYTSYCKWHTGPLDKRDDPLKRVYCRRYSYTRLGYCREHDDSIRAIYDKCFSSSTLHGLTYCSELDSRFKNKLKYVVYLLDYGYGFKVGSTRKWRLIDRVGEQPHVIAAELVEYDSAVKTRELEIKIGLKEGFTERPHKRSIRDVLARPPKLSYRKLVDAVNKLSKEYGIENEWRKVFRVIPYNNDITDFIKAQNAQLKDIVGKRLEIYGYWLGYLLLADTNSNRYFLVKSKELLHRDTIGLIK